MWNYELFLNITDLRVYKSIITNIMPKICLRHDWDFSKNKNLVNFGKNK